MKEGIDPGSTYYDGTSPKTLEIPGGGTWTVNNSERGGGGTYDLESATWDSVNVVFAQLDLDVGPENVTETAQEMGIESPLQSVPAEGIGGLAIGVTPLEMADAYATLANGGIHHDPTAVSKVEFPDGKVDDFEKDSGERVLTQGQAYEVTRILEGVITQGTGAGYTSMGCSGAAGKTGTSEELSDAWFVGYTPLFSTAVWVGHPTIARIHRLRRSHRRARSGPTTCRKRVEGDCPEFETGSAARTRRPRQRTHLLGQLQAATKKKKATKAKKKKPKTKARARKRAAKKAAKKTPPNPNPNRPPNPLRRRNRPRRPAPAAGGRHQPRLIEPTPNFGAHSRPNLGAASLLPDQLDPVAVGVADEADAVALGAAAGAVGGLFGLDAQRRPGARGWRRGRRRRGRCGCSRCRGRSESTPWL